MVFEACVGMEVSVRGWGGGGVRNGVLVRLGVVYSYG